MKIYCNDCKYLSGSNFIAVVGNARQYECLYPENHKRIEDWRGGFISISYPETINCNNDCEWFEKK